MSLFSEKWQEALITGEYICDECGSLMEFENENEDTLVCPSCGYSVDIDRYGFTDEEYESLYPTKEEVEVMMNAEGAKGKNGGGKKRKKKKNDYNGETYDKVYGELHLDD